MTYAVVYYEKGDVHCYAGKDPSLEEKGRDL
jgi:hypothetical protein